MGEKVRQTAAELEGAEQRVAAAAAGGDAEALAAAKREVGKAAERYCAVCECEEEMRAKVRPDMVVEGRRGREKCDMAGLLEGKSDNRANRGAPTRTKFGNGPCICTKCT